MDSDAHNQRARGAIISASSELTSPPTKQYSIGSFMRFVLSRPRRSADNGGQHTKVLNTCKNILDFLLPTNHRLCGDCRESRDLQINWTTRWTTESAAKFWRLKTARRMSVSAGSIRRTNCIPFICASFLIDCQEMTWANPFTLVAKVEGNGHHQKKKGFL